MCGMVCSLWLWYINGLRSTTWKSREGTSFIEGHAPHHCPLMAKAPRPASFLSLKILPHPQYVDQTEATSLTLMTSVQMYYLVTLDSNDEQRLISHTVLSSLDDSFYDLMSSDVGCEVTNVTDRRDFLFVSCELFAIFFSPDGLFFELVCIQVSSSTCSKPDVFLQNRPWNCKQARNLLFSCFSCRMQKQLSGFLISLFGCWLCNYGNHVNYELGK